VVSIRTGTLFVSGLRPWRGSMAFHVEDIASHSEKRTSNIDYDARCRNMYSILQFRTAMGTAGSEVANYESTEDGALAWKNLKDYYDQEGDKDIFETKCLKEISNLKLRFNSPGGFDRFHDEFEKLCRHIAECGEPLSEREKRAFLLNGIEDSDYSATKDLCAYDVYSTVVAKLRRKAADLGRQNGPSRRQQNKVTRRTGRGKPAATLNDKDEIPEGDKKACS